MEEKRFLQFVSNYNLENIDINLKYEHSLRVMNLQIKYAKLLNFTEEDIYLAKIIGLLHDIGRFEQLKIYKTYLDSKSVDHAALGIDMLFAKGLIKEFKIPVDYYETITYAIFYHNKLDIGLTDSEQKLRQAKLIRDTDKLDILYLLSMLNVYDEKPVEENISEKVILSILKHEQVNKLDRHNPNDFIATKYGFIFDVNNDILLPEFKNYYELYYKKIGSEKFRIIYEEVLKYIEERMNNYERTRKKI